MPFNSGQVQSGLMRKITILADEFVVTMKSTIDEVRAPSEIKEHISMGNAEKAGDGISIDVSIDISEDGAPMAPAYEWGSGLQRTRGTPSLYPIKAKDVSNPLHFFWVERQKWFIGVELPYGHPGVSPRPFIVPSIKKILPKMKQELGKTIKAELLVGVEKVTVIRA